MTDHLEDAAARSVELAAELANPVSYDDEEGWNETVGRRIRIAQHLTYVAGLIRGSRLRPTNEAEPFRVKSWTDGEAARVDPQAWDTYSPSRSGARRSTPQDGTVRFYPHSGTSYEQIQSDEPTELALLRAERGRAGAEIMRLQRVLNARENDFQRLSGDFQLAKMAHANELTELRSQVKTLNEQVKKAADERCRLIGQRNDLLDAARCVIAPRPGHDSLDLLRETTDRIMQRLEFS